MRIESYIKKIHILRRWWAGCIKDRSFIRSLIVYTNCGSNSVVHLRDLANGIHDLQAEVFWYFGLSSFITVIFLRLVKLLLKQLFIFYYTIGMFYLFGPGLDLSSICFLYLVYP